MTDESKPHEPSRSTGDSIDEEMQKAAAARERSKPQKEIEPLSLDLTPPVVDPPSILDSIEPSDLRARTAEQFGGGDAGRSVRRITPEQQARLIRVAGLGIALAGIFLLLQGLQQRGLVKDPLPTGAPSAAAATATPLPPSPIAQASPQVNRTGIATASFTKVSGPCRLAAQFTDRYSFAATGGALTLTQLSDNHVTTGRIEPSGDFTTTATGQGYKGRVTGATAEGQHTYTADGCNEVYAFKMTFPTPLLAAPIVPATIAVAVTSAAPSPIATTAAPASAPAAPTGGPNVALAALGLVLTVGGLGVVARGPALMRAAGKGDRSV